MAVPEIVTVIVFVSDVLSASVWVSESASVSDLVSFDALIDSLGEIGWQISLVVVDNVELLSCHSTNLSHQICHRD